MTKNLTQLDYTATGNTFADMANLVNQLVATLANEILTTNSALGGGAMSAGNGFNIGIFGSNTITASLLRGGNVTTANVVYLGSNLDSNGFTYISGNVSVNTTTFFVGNSTFYNYSNQTIFEIVAPTTNAIINSSSIFTGNSTANAFINSTSISLGSALANATINSSGIFFDGSSLAATLPPVTNTTAGFGTFVIDFFPLNQYRACEYALVANDLANPNNYQASKLLVIHNGTQALSTEYAIITTNSSVGSWTTTANNTSVILQYTPVSSSCKLTGTRNLIAL